MYKLMFCVHLFDIVILVILAHLNEDNCRVNTSLFKSREYEK